jgi:hypothetical protein
LDDQIQACFRRHVAKGGQILHVIGCEYEHDYAGTTCVCVCINMIYVFVYANVFMCVCTRCCTCP